MLAISGHPLSCLNVCLQFRLALSQRYGRVKRFRVLFAVVLIDCVRVLLPICTSAAAPPHQPQAVQDDDRHTLHRVGVVQRQYAGDTVWKVGEVVANDESARYHPVVVCCPTHPQPLTYNVLDIVTRVIIDGMKSVKKD